MQLFTTTVLEKLTGMIPTRRTGTLNLIVQKMIEQRRLSLNLEIERKQHVFLSCDYLEARQAVFQRFPTPFA